MVFKAIKRMISPSLSAMISRQSSRHKSSGYDFHKDIACVILKDYSGPNISACLKSSNPDAGGIGISQQIWFFKFNVDSIEEGFNRLTPFISHRLCR